MNKTKILVGTSGWNYPDWKDNFYPPWLKQKDWFSYYQTQFPIVEINATFYRFFDKKVFIKWRGAAKKSFCYIIKVPRSITHIRRLKKVKRLVKVFCKLVDNLDDNLGLILMQLPPKMAYEPERLDKALNYFDDPKKVVVEFRDPKWQTNEVMAILRKYKATYCISDSPASKLTAIVTSKYAYIRMHGAKRWYNYNYSKTELNNLIEFIMTLKKQKVKKIYILFNNDWYSYAAKNALYIKKCLESK